MEFISGYREPILDFSEVLFSWYKRYLSDRENMSKSDIDPREWENWLRGLPYDPLCWVIHVLSNKYITFQSKNSELQTGDGFYADDLRLCDLEKYINLIDLDRDNNQDGDDLYCVDYTLMVAEENGILMGVDFLMNGGDNEQLGSRAFQLLCHSMARPLGADQPRRPTKVVVDNAKVHNFLAVSLPFLGVLVEPKPLRDWSLSPKFSFSTRAVPSCHVCKKRSFETALFPCVKCGAVIYCSKKCESLDWKKRPTDISHEYWCGMMAQYMKREGELASLPFPFTREVTSSAFDKEKFLSERELTKGYWSAESLHRQTYRMLLKRETWDLDEDRYEPLLKDTDIILRQHPMEGPKKPLTTWKEYYNWRKLSLDNPIAALMTYPLTIYHVITRLVPQHFPELNILNKKSLKIHILEASREYESILLFWELAVLMPHTVLELVFAGETLSAEEDERHFVLHKKGTEIICSDLTYFTKDRDGLSIQVRVHVRPYHDLLAAKPDLVIGFNCGFGLKDTWLSTLPRLQSLKVPAFFSDCSLYSCDVDGQVVAMATGGVASPPTINPFRSPLRISATDNCMPWYNNDIPVPLDLQVCPAERINQEKESYIPQGDINAI
ncbi:zinc finger MYND domain-containing protein 15 [Bombina bombina]|uniref:zinc finger MYND domain-containing protein 15 n=1 Tax=Bombina bombina TaxID=8345 RepID=UPI00235A64F1|nr:zinc finger MYND domain-containing protein 15 [Bombina bombina]